MNQIRIPYNRSRYIYPPRPENAVNPERLVEYEHTGQNFGAQPKLNGDCMVVITNGVETDVWNRHKERFTAKINLEPTFKQLHRQTVSDVPGDTDNKFMVLCGEYMKKSKKNHNGELWNQKFVIFDIIAYDGYQLVGTTFRERIELLDRLYGKDDVLLTPDGVEKMKFLYTTPVKDVFRVKTFEDCFGALYADLTDHNPTHTNTEHMYEGLVLKDLDAALENGTTEKNNQHWAFKFRQSTKNFRF